jgi:CHRD domain
VYSRRDRKQWLQEAVMFGQVVFARWMAVALLVVAGSAGCGGGAGYASGRSSNPVMVVRSASLSAVPTVTTSATGGGALIVHPNTYQVMGGITFTGLTGVPTEARITRADNTTVVTLLLASRTATDTATVPDGFNFSASDQAQLLAGTLFFTVSSAAHPSPGGEIRGTVSVTTGVTAGLATLSAGQEVPPNASTATGRGMIVFDSATRAILIAYATHSVSLANAAHIHTGAPAAVGAPIVTLAADGTTIYFAQPGATLTLQDATDLNAGNTYFNVHSPAYPNGEIRGQIVVQ